MEDSKPIPEKTPAVPIPQTTPAMPAATPEPPAGPRKILEALDRAQESVPEPPPPALPAAAQPVELPTAPVLPPALPAAAQPLELLAAPAPPTPETPSLPDAQMLIPESMRRLEQMLKTIKTKNSESR